ncbi:hypothetical protein ACFQDG_09900 [Natronoarchaeum mannanilyticum]|uniref:Uncharacterized protein n=1 Tax=Natronoarchaeum mannanilyticum TaxID=926360 RepID=A0AAV3T5R1_9EURY
MAVEDNEDHPPKNLMVSILESIREAYVEEHGEEPPEEFMQRARNEIVHNFASKDRDEHRDIYEALAKE